MRAVPGRGSLVAALAIAFGMALAFAIALMVFASSANAAEKVIL